jgi:hypothetical protein
MLFVITTCVVDGNPQRDAQYRRCISRTCEVASALGAAVAIVEGNGARSTLLTEFADRASIVYTNNNAISGVNKGYIELLDVRSAIAELHTDPQVVVVKVTGRYFIEEGSPFIELLSRNPGSAVVKFGSFIHPANELCEDCVTGLIAMRACDIQKIKLPSLHECVEWCWARAATQLPPSELVAVQGPMGLSLCPGSDDYFSI